MTNQPALNAMGNDLIRIDGVVTHFVDTFRRCDGGLGGLQCEEAEAMAHALEVLGGKRGIEAALNVIRVHAADGDEDPSSGHHREWHELNEGVPCEAGEECEVLVQRRKDGS